MTRLERCNGWKIGGEDVVGQPQTATKGLGFFLGDPNERRGTRGMRRTLVNASDQRIEHCGRSDTQLIPHARIFVCTSRTGKCRASELGGRFVPHITASLPRRFLPPPRVPTMDTKSQRPKGQDNVVSSLNVAIDAANLTKEILSITPAKAICGSISVILTMIRVCFLQVCNDPN